MPGARCAWATCCRACVPSCRARPPRQAEPQAAPPELVPAYGDTWRIGVLYGPHGAPDFFKPEAIDAFFAADWEVHYNSNRLGVRLTGPKPDWARESGEAGLHPSNIHDCEYAIGSINFTGDSPVILTRDGPSLGGFVCRSRSPRPSCGRWGRSSRVTASASCAWTMNRRWRWRRRRTTACAS